MMSSLFVCCCFDKFHFILERYRRSQRLHFFCVSYIDMSYDKYNCIGGEGWYWVLSNGGP